jgi:alkanesulfonate monooxygenase SsuD/methylene tetrahydromethanopterin reductase-like flavin-dependent oxidoreductase (luciferase family)
VKLGILVESEEGLTWPAWRRVVGACDGLGFESVWISDHLLSAAGDNRGGVDAWLALALAAADSRRLVLGPLVTPITFRMPGLLARMAANLYDLSQGRFVLGLGAGWNDREHAAFGIPFPPGAERLHLLDTGLELIRRTLGAPVPVLVGGMGRGTLRLVVRYADEWNLTTNAPSRVGELGQTLATLCQVAGRDPGSILRSVSVGVLIGRDRAELLRRSEAMRRLVPALAETPADQVLDAARDHGWLAGTPAEVVAGLRGLAAVGVHRAMLGHYDLDDTDALELIAREVLPAVGD